ncbi:MAG: hypothetical protein Q4B22_08125 [Eubacteriales bacterium]|nr:hypothetical protein [Eubacteriales bacterium]
MPASSAAADEIELPVESVSNEAVAELFSAEENEKTYVDIDEGIGWYGM